MAVLAPTVVLALALLQAAQPTTETRPATHSQSTANVSDRTLALPHVLRKGETAWLLVEVGAIGHHQIQFTTQDGRPLGTISPSGERAVASSSSQTQHVYPLPIPPDAF